MIVRRALVALSLVVTSVAIGVAPMATGGAAPAGATTSAATTPKVLRVGTWKGMAGDYTTIEDAVKAAGPGDWILVGPGDYHEQADHHLATTPDDATGAVYITTPNVHLRGMDRNKVIIDGTKPGSPQCDSAAASQDLGPLNSSNQPMGRNGVEAFKADGVTIDNLTACNFLTGSNGGGNGIWWNGGDGSGKIGMGPYGGSYLTASTTYYAGENAPKGNYGIFVSNAKGPAVIIHTYASNMDDSAYYIGACQDCNVVLDDAHAQHSALGYSGTNSGGHLIIQNGEWDDNKTGIVTNSQNNDDAPSPQDGICPTGMTGPTGTTSCWIVRNNYIHDNNNPNVPNAGSAAAGPVGTGLVLAGGRHDIVANNRVAHNGSWGILTAPYPDDGNPPPISNCEGGVKNFIVKCWYGDVSNEIANNTFANNGFYGNPTNGDLADISGPPGNCWHGNTDPKGVTTAPANLQTTNANCAAQNQGAGLGDALTDQVLCATQALAPCPNSPGKTYPRTEAVTLRPLVAQTTMPDPCLGVPANTWCPAPPVTPTTPVPAQPVSTPATPISTNPKFTG